MRLLAIDPGSTESAYIIIDQDTRAPIELGKMPNGALLNHLWGSYHTDWLGAGDPVVIEMVASYGMPVGAEVFDTCVWIGRFAEAAGRDADWDYATLVKRQPVKLHHCHSPKATDATVKQALIDRFAYGQRNHGKGTKAEPGWFHGFHHDIWQAFALAVYAADKLDAEEAL